MIPAEIVQVALIVLFVVLWLVEGARTRAVRKELEAERDKTRQLEVENASLSGALAERALRPPS